MLSARHHPAFEALTPDTARVAWEHIHRRYPTRFPAPPSEEVCGLELLARVQDAGLDHAQVVLTMAPATAVPAIRAVETLVGRPIQRRASPPPTSARTPAAPRAPAAPRSSVGSIDSAMVVVSVVPNPKKPGSSAHERFARYQVGMTVAQLLAAGITRADLKWDAERAHIVLGAPDGQ